mmetsp:Transcript_57235/g.159297  ORF Transcript_57235/g.159297 Transcript_57235/m.159297 type:complete len:276 (-) Transcript_57235:156-983(-)
MSLSSTRGSARVWTSIATEWFPKSRHAVRTPSAPSWNTTPGSRQPWMVLRAIVGEVCAPLTLIAEPTALERSQCSTRQLPWPISSNAAVRALLTRGFKAEPPTEAVPAVAAASRHMATFAKRAPLLISSVASIASLSTVPEVPSPRISTSWSIWRVCNKACSPVNNLMPNDGILLPRTAWVPVPTSRAAHEVPRTSASDNVATSRGTTISQQTLSRNWGPSESGFASGPNRESTPESRINFRRLWFGISVLLARQRPVMGDEEFSASQASIFLRS